MLTPIADQPYTSQEAAWHLVQRQNGAVAFLHLWSGRYLCFDRATESLSSCGGAMCDKYSTDFDIWPRLVHLISSVFYQNTKKISHPTDLRQTSVADVIQTSVRRRWASDGRSTDVRRTSVGRPLDVRLTSVGRPSDVRQTSAGRPLDVRRTSVRRLSDVYVSCQM